MSRIRLIMLSMLAVFAIGAVASASASAACARVAEPNTGNKDYTCVTNVGPTANQYINVLTPLETELKPGEWCAKVETKETGNYSKNNCEAGSKKEKSEFIKVFNECPDVPTGGDVALCKGGKEVEGTFPFKIAKVAATSSKLEVTGGPTVVCEKAEGTGQWEASDSSLETSDIYIRFSGKCEVTNNAETKAECKVTEPIKVTGGETGKEPPEVGADDGLDGVFTGASPKVLTLFPSELTGGKKVFTVITITGAGCTFKVSKAKVIGEQECKIVTPQTEKAIQNLKCETSGSKLKFGATENTAVFEAEVETELTGTEAKKPFGAYAS